MRTPKVRNKELDYEVLIDNSNHISASEWCLEHVVARWSPIDNRSGRWSMFWAGPSNFSKYRFCFADEKDVLWFTLSWS